MPEKKTVEKAKKALRKGNKPSTAAGEFVREEIHHIREGKHGARSTKQAIAIGLSKARRAGVPLEAPKGKGKKKTRKAAERDLKAGKRRKKTTSKKRSRASKRALKREGRKAASKKALSRHAKRTSEQRRRTQKRNAKKGNSRKKTQRRAA